MLFINFYFYCINSFCFPWICFVTLFLVFIYVQTQPTLNSRKGRCSLGREALAQGSPAPAAPTAIPWSGQASAAHPPERMSGSCWWAGSGRHVGAFGKGNRPLSPSTVSASSSPSSNALRGWSHRHGTQDGWPCLHGAPVLTGHRPEVVITQTVG